MPYEMIKFAKKEAIATVECHNKGIKIKGEFSE